MPYIGHAPTNSGNFYILDDFNGLGQDGVTSTYDQNANGTIVNYKLMVAGVAITPNVDNLIVTIDGVLQHPTDAYTISGSILTFTGAPASGVDFHIVIMGQSSTVGEGSIGADELQVSGDGTNNQLLKSDGDGTMSWINQNTVTASTAATLATARTIGGVSFDGSANIAVTLAATATTLATARAINGVNFDGSAAITVTADANTLSNTTLKSTVVTSSLTSVGTIGTGVWQGTAVASAYLDADTAHLSGTQTFSGAKTFSAAASFSANVGFTANVSLNDNDLLQLGSGDDLRLYHDGSNSYIKSTTGWLNMPIGGSGVSIANSDFSESLARFLVDGACELYHNGTKRIETTSSGATVSGKLDVDASGGSGGAAHDGTYGNVMFDSNNHNYVQIGSPSDRYGALFFSDDVANAGHIYYFHTDNSMRFGTNTSNALTLDSSQNATFAGQVTATGIKFDASGEVLDDYEEGTTEFSSGYTNGAGGTTTFHSSYDVIAWTRIGRVVHVQGMLIHTGYTGTNGEYRIGLPFVVGGGGSALEYRACNAFHDTNGGSGDAYTISTRDAGTSYATVVKSGVGADTTLDSGDVGSRVQFSLTYLTS